MEALAPYGALFASAFIAATLLPAQSELLLAGLVAAGKGDPLLLLIVGTVGNTAGARWMLKETAALPPGRTANIDAAHAALLQARLAVDAALQALEA